MGHAALRRGQEAADYSCLASIHGTLERQGALNAVAAHAAWRQWTDGEVAGVLSGVEPGDCADKSWWQGDVGIRTRRLADGRIEAFLWRKSHPVIFSTGIERPSNNELQRTRPAQAMEPRR